MLNSFALELKKNNVCAIFRIKKKKKMTVPESAESFMFGGLKRDQFNTA